MPKRFKLETSAQEFSRELAGLLNRTICDGIRLTAVEHPSGHGFSVGYGLSKRDWVSRPIPLTIGKSPRLYLTISYRLGPDEWTEHMAVMSSVFMLSLDKDGRRELLHVDYERHKEDGYPEAHMQVVAGSEDWSTLSSSSPDAKQSLGRMHLPVGDRRYRPSLEDLVRFLVVERLVEAKPDWAGAVEEGRQRFFDRQLRAAVRRHPDIAREVLDELLG